MEYNKREYLITEEGYTNPEWKDRYEEYMTAIGNDPEIIRFYKGKDRYGKKRIGQKNGLMIIKAHSQYA